MTTYSCVEEDSFDASEFEAELLEEFPQQKRSTSLHEPYLWGYLQHVTGSLTRVDFWKICPEVTFGRDASNTIVLRGPTISFQHCAITWNGKEDDQSTIIVQDNSSNGTYINGKKIGKGRTSILRDGNEIAFGTAIPQDDNRAQDFRFIFRHGANGKAPEGLHDFYDVGHEIGHGTFGTVVKALSRRTGEWCAVKIISERLAFPTKAKGQEMDEDIAINRRALAREVAILGKLKHPNICQLKEIFLTGANGIQIVLEYVNGGNLHEHLLTNIGEAASQHITFQICSALRYVHGMGIVHRDLKPANILITKDKPPIVKVADFGLAKAVDNQTMLRTQCGTPSYVAPEVIAQKIPEGLGHLVDSWSIGVIVFNMLTIASPFEASSDFLETNSERVVNWTPLINANVSKEANDFIRCLLVINPHDRMSMVDALAHRWLIKLKGRTRKVSFINDDMNAGPSRPKKLARKA